MVTGSVDSVSRQPAVGSWISVVVEGEPPPEPPSASSQPRNPYKGLRAFQESDAGDFFGREDLASRLLSRMANETQMAGFLAEVGPSGCGKSSVVRAGIVPAIRTGALHRSEQWTVVEMVPGARPFEELEAALLRVAVNLPASLLPQLLENDLGIF